MIGLALEGLDPNHHGFCFNAAALSSMRAQLEGGYMALSNLAVWTWMEIQQKVATRTRLELDGLDEFFAWLQGVSIPHCQAKFKAASLHWPRAMVLRYLRNRSEPVGRWIRKWRGDPFP